VGGFGGALACEDALALGFRDRVVGLLAAGLEEGLRDAVGDVRVGAFGRGLAELGG
jgi:hypothetical protein